ncbi:MAG: hypothetical protein J6Y48_03995, partial [Clostridia bacterium]|nr:hypothetical protein [Clostridia bacterium]
MSEADKDIRLTNDLRLTKSYTLSNDMELDLNGHTLTSTISAPLFTVNGKLTVKGGNASTNGQLARVNNGGDMTVENGVYNASAADMIRVG